MATIYMAEVGVIKDEDKFIIDTTINGKQYNLHIINTAAFLDEEKAIKFRDDYVSKGIDKTYGFIYKIEQELYPETIEEIEKYGYVEAVENIPDNFENVDLKIKGEK